MTVLRKATYIAIALLCLAVGIYFGLQNSANRPAALHSINLPDTEKELRSGEEWLGKVVVVNHWATWCAPCREEIPMLISFQSHMAHADVQVLGIAHDLLDAAKAFASQSGMNYPSLVAITGGNELLRAHGNTNHGALPYTAIFNRQGIQVVGKLGLLTYEELYALVSAHL